MNKRQDALERFVTDAVSYLMFECTQATEKNEPRNDQRIVETLAHDLGGLFRKEKCFSPRVTGYARKMIQKYKKGV